MTEEKAPRPRAAGWGQRSSPVETRGPLPGVRHPSLPGGWSPPHTRRCSQVTPLEFDLRLPITPHGPGAPPAGRVGATGWGGWGGKQSLGGCRSGRTAAEPLRPAMPEARCTAPLSKFPLPMPQGHTARQGPGKLPSCPQPPPAPRYLASHPTWASDGSPCRLPVCTLGKASPFVRDHVQPCLQCARWSPLSQDGDPALAEAELVFAALSSLAPGPRPPTVAE